jgi:hypothetical protein
LAPFIVLSSSSANEPNYECYGEDFKVYGSLSYAFCKVLSNSGENETYRGFFAKLQLQMKILVENQSPEIGGFPDRKTWAGSSIKSEPYYMVKKLDLSKIEINAGQLHGVLDGSKIELYPVGTYVSENERPTLTGRVTEADLFTATVELDNPLGNSDYWAYVSEKSFGNVIAKIGFMGFESGTLLDTLTAYLKRSPIIRVGEETADFLIEIQNSTQLILRNTSTGATIGKPFRMIRSYSYLAQLKSEIEKLTKSKFLLDFNPHSEGLDAYLQIIPSPSAFLKDTVSIANILVNGQLKLNIGQRVFLKVVNESDRKIYYNIIDFGPEGDIDVLVPQMSNANGLGAVHDGSEYWIEARGEAIIPKNQGNSMTIGEPLGQETIKLIISEEPLDLRGLATNKGLSRGMNPLNEIEKVFDLAGKMSVRELKRETYSSKSSATSYSLSFEIIP